MTKQLLPCDAKLAGTFHLGNELAAYRMGFGAMRLTGTNVWGEPKNPDDARILLKKALEFGINFIDTADSYGPEVSENYIAQALYPYPKELIIATKGGILRPGPDMWVPCGKPEYIIQCVEMSLRRLRLDQIDLYQLHAIDPEIPLEETLEALKLMQKQGKIRFIGLSNVSVSEIERAQKIVKIVSVQNRYNIGERQSEDVLKYCENHHLAFIPWFPIASGNLARAGGPLEKVAKSKGVTQSQVALAWLLNHSKVCIPIPGTSHVEHLEENIAASSLKLTEEEMRHLGG